jgi:holliday junction DNA helicase RuvA
MSVLARLRGTVTEKNADSVIVFAGGLGFAVQVPLSTMQVLPAPGQETLLRTQLYVREGSLTLYGFASEQEERLFELLVTVSGVGPKAALSCLSCLGVDQLSAAIVSEDAASLRRVPGIGQRTADRILLELKGRLPEWAKTSGPAPAQGDPTIAALMFYGYSAADAAAAVAALPGDSDMTVEQRTLLALQYFAPQSERSAGRR